MSEQKNKKTKQSKNNTLKNLFLGYIIPFIASVLGAFIMSLPWALAYGYYKNNWGFLTILIPIGAFWGYKYSRGKMNIFSYFAVILASVIAFGISSEIMIPVFTNLYMKESINISGFYGDSVIRKQIMVNYSVAALFEVIMIAYICISMKLQFDRNAEEIYICEKISYDVENIESHELFKKIFKKFSATSQERAITKEQIYDELDDRSSDIIRDFKTLKRIGYVQRVGNRYFYTGISKINKTGRFFDRFTFFIIMVTLLVIIGLLFGMANQFIYRISDSNVSYLMKPRWILDNEFTNSLKRESASFSTAMSSNTLGEDGSYELIDDVEKVNSTENYFYLVNDKYKYLLNQDEEELGIKEKASIMDVSVKVNYENENSFDSFDRMKEVLYKYMTSGEIQVGEMDFSEFVSNQGYKVYCIEYDELIAENLYYRKLEYFIYTEDKMGYVSVNVPKFERLEDAREDILFLINSFKFK